MKGDKNEKVTGTVFPTLDRRFEGCLLKCHGQSKDRV